MKQERYILDEMDKEILESLKVQLRIHTEMLIDRNLRKSNIEIEVIHFLKKLLLKE
jgi:hypothetical protein